MMRAGVSIGALTFLACGRRLGKGDVESDGGANGTGGERDPCIHRVGTTGSRYRAR